MIIFKSQIPVARWLKLKKISHIKVTLLFLFAHFSILMYCTTHSTGHASGCWLSALGAGLPYNREKKQKSSLHSPHPTNFLPYTRCSMYTIVPLLLLSGATHFFNLVPPLSRLFVATQSFFVVAPSYKLFGATQIFCFKKNSCTWGEGCAN